MGEGTYAQPLGVVTPKKQSSGFLGTTWFARTGVMTTPAEAMEAPRAMTRAKIDFIAADVVVVENEREADQLSGIMYKDHSRESERRSGKSRH